MLSVSTFLTSPFVKDLDTAVQLISATIGQPNFVRYKKNRTGIAIFFDDVLWNQSSLVDQFRAKIAEMASDSAKNNFEYAPKLKLSLANKSYTFKFMASLSAEQLNTGVYKIIESPAEFRSADIFIPTLGIVRTKPPAPDDCAETFRVILLSCTSITNFSMFTSSFCRPIKAYTSVRRLDGKYRHIYDNVVIHVPEVRKFFIENPRRGITVNIETDGFIESLVFTGMLMSQFLDLV
jgi:hypothetical protein